MQILSSIAHTQSASVVSFYSLSMCYQKHVSFIFYFGRSFAVFEWPCLFCIRRKKSCGGRTTETFLLLLRASRPLVRPTVRPPVRPSARPPARPLALPSAEASEAWPAPCYSKLVSIHQRLAPIKRTSRSIVKAGFRQISGPPESAHFWRNKLHFGCVLAPPRIGRGSCGGRFFGPRFWDDF